jgi:hypothetical protein
MGSLIEFYSGSEDGQNTALSELRLGVEPTMALLFTADCDDVRLHYIGDESVKAYVICPGAGCPACHCAVEPQLFNLLPVLDVASGTVKVLRISARRQRGGLGPLLVPLLRSQDVGSRVILISRNVAQYRVESRPLGMHADRGEAAIKAFLDQKAGGLKLESAFPQMTHEELSDVPSIAAKLAAIGSWKPPSHEGSEPATDQETSGSGSEES